MTHHIVTVTGVVNSVCHVVVNIDRIFISLFIVMCYVFSQTCRLCEVLFSYWFSYIVFMLCVANN